MIRLILGHMPADRVHIWFQDEARFGQQNTTTRIWAAKGSRPRTIKQQQFEYAYLFGAVCPSTGETEALIAPWVDKEVMQKHLALISKRTRAGWHTDDIAAQFENLSIIKLPPYSPELNPIEQVWQWLRQRKLANRCFENYEDIVEQCSKAWNSFINDIDLVKKLCSRKWTITIGS